MSETISATPSTNSPDSIPLPPSVSFWDGSPHLRSFLERRLSPSDLEWARPALEEMGMLAAEEIPPLAATADLEGPRLVTHSPRGERIDRVDYHPAYRRMEEIAYGSGMIGIKYDSEAVAEHPHAVQLVGFALGYLFCMAEAGLYCPICMTDGAARVLTLHGTGEQIGRVVPRLASRSLDTLWTGAMFLTERQGGSDVGKNETTAERATDGSWRLTGEKWFCSNVDAEVVMVTARPRGATGGTRGLRTFMMLAPQPGIRIDRLKPKLGVRSMPTGEVTLAGARAEEVGGFEATLTMLNMSRLYNSVGSVAVIGRAIHEARSHVEQRQAFGRPVIEHALAAETVADLEAEHLAAFLMTFEAVDALGRADRGDDDAAALVRILTPIVKLETAKLAVPAISEAMELIGGNGYIEESVLPRLLRDGQVFPIWEGTTNILVLDTMRAIRKSGAHEAMLETIRKHFPGDAAGLESSLDHLEERRYRSWVDRLTRLYQRSLLIEHGRDEVAERLAGRPMGMIPGAGG